VIHSSGKERLSDLGGLARQMPLSLILYMVGAFSISGVPLFNGFISKSLVTTGAAEAGQGLVVLLLNLASVGTFLSVAIKLPYFAWFGSNGETRAGEAPLHMLVAMAITAVFCVGLGVAPHWLYVRLPYPPVHYEPYTAAHVFEALLLLSFTGVGFWWLRERLQPHRGITLDTDWFYRWPAARFVQAVSSPLEKAMVGLGERAAALVSLASQLARNPTLAARRLLRGESAFRAKRAGQATSGWDALPPYDEDRQRLPIGVWLLSIGGVFVFLALALMFSTHGD
jgi:multicomponent Na+:H+ antiporter subunit D